METILHPDQIAAMDDMRDHPGLLTDADILAANERRMDEIQRAIATQPMSERTRRALWAEHEDCEQQNALIEQQADAESNRIAAELGDLLKFMAVVLAAITAVHMIVRLSQ